MNWFTEGQWKSAGQSVKRRQAILLSFFNAVKKKLKDGFKLINYQILINFRMDYRFFKVSFFY